MLLIAMILLPASMLFYANPASRAMCGLQTPAALARRHR